MLPIPKADPKIYNMNKYTHDDKVVDAIVAWMALVWILFGVCMLGLTLTIVKAILLAFGIENNL